MVPEDESEIANGAVGGVGIYLGSYMKHSMTDLPLNVNNKGKRPITSKNYAEKGRMLACAALPGREGSLRVLISV